MSQRAVVEASMYTAITFLATVLLVVETPATGGYFNLGEAAIYSIAFVASTPIVAAVASGLGPALADIVLGYGYFAPATLVIKFAEGYIVSYLARSLRRGGVKPWMRAASVGLAAALALVVALGLGGLEGGAGVTVYWTPTSLLGVEVPVPSVSFQLPSFVWILLALALLGLGAIPALVAGEKPYVFATSMGGLVMVTGYFLYEFFISNPLILGRDPVGAFFEVPVNVGQVTAGIALSYPVVRFLERAKGEA